MARSSGSADAHPKIAWQALIDREANAGCNELNLLFTLTNGQAFGWQMLPAPPAAPVAGVTRELDTAYSIIRPSSEIWAGVVGRHVVALRHLEEEVQFAGLTPGSAMSADSLRGQLKDLFQLQVSMMDLYSTWSVKDPRMAVICRCLPGMRILRQTPWECLISFICSSNNNIKRITQMLSKLRSTFGNLLAEVNGVKFHSFPGAEVLAKVPEAHLRELGFGYRAPFVIQTAIRVCELGGEDLLDSLRAVTRKEAQTKLMEFQGVGRKVADCVALFSLDHPGCIPVDTHVWAIAHRYMDRSLIGSASITDKIYERVGDLFRLAYGDRAGWAHSLLFAAELPVFNGYLPAGFLAEMEAVREQEKKAKSTLKEAAKAAKQPAVLDTSPLPTVKRLRKESSASSSEVPTAIPAKRPRRASGQKG